jgi:hypothetical protein
MKNDTPPFAGVQDFPNPSCPELTDQDSNPTMDIWEPPFERWMKLADDLLRQWPIESRPTSSRPLLAPTARDLRHLPPGQRERGTRLEQRALPA